MQVFCSFSRVKTSPSSQVHIPQNVNSKYGPARENDARRSRLSISPKAYPIFRLVKSPPLLCVSETKQRSLSSFHKKRKEAKRAQRRRRRNVNKGLRRGERVKKATKLEGGKQCRKEKKMKKRDGGFDGQKKKCSDVWHR